MGDYTIIPQGVKIDEKTIVKNDQGEIEVQGSYIFQYRLSNTALYIQNINIAIPQAAAPMTVYTTTITQTGTYRFGVIMNVTGSSINYSILFKKNGTIHKSYTLTSSGTIFKTDDIPTSANDEITISVSCNSSTSITVTEVGIYGDAIPNPSVFTIYK